MFRFFVRHLNNYAVPILLLVITPVFFYFSTSILQSQDTKIRVLHLFLQKHLQNHSFLVK